MHTRRAPPPRREGVADELVRSEQGLSFPEVVRELGRMLIGVLAVEPLQRLGDVAHGGALVS